MSKIIFLLIISSSICSFVQILCLIALAWRNDTWFAGAEVNHINGNKYDNRACNLEWVTHSGNLKHSYRVLGREKLNSPKGNQ